MSEGRGLHCPNCSQQVAPGVRCWSCGTVTPMSLGRKMANVGACFAPLLVCAFLSGFGALMSYFDAKTRAKRDQEQQKLKAEEDKRTQAEEQARLDEWRAKNPPPAYPVGALHRPIFVTDVGTSLAGVAFVVDGVAERPVVLTALHLLGPPGGLEAKIEAWEVRDKIRDVALNPGFDPPSPRNQIHVGRNAIPLALNDDRGSPAGDVAAFWTPKTVAWVETFRLATARPQKKDRLWLLAPLLQGSERLHPVQCVGVSADELVFIYENRDIKLKATTGAPILNGAGEVVGVNGGARWGAPPQTPLIGFATPVWKFLNPLRRACQAHPPGK